MVIENFPDFDRIAAEFPGVMMDDEMPSTGTRVEQLAGWVRDEAAREKILVDNPERLYGCVYG